MARGQRKYANSLMKKQSHIGKTSSSVQRVTIYKSVKIVNNARAKKNIFKTEKST